MTAQSETSTWRRHEMLAVNGLPLLRRVALFFAAYVALDVIGATVANISLSDLRWNLALGVSITAAYRYGIRALPFIFASALISDVWVAERAHAVPSHALSYSAWHSILMTAESIIPVVFARILTRATGKSFLTNTWFAALLIAVPVSFVTAALYSGSLIIGAMPTLQFWDDVARLWVGDLGGILVVAPFLLMLIEAWDRPAPFKTVWRWEALGQVLFVISLVWFVFVENAQTVREFFYVLSLPIIWITWRHGCAGAVVVNAFLLAILITFLSKYDSGGVLQLPTRMMVLVTTGLTLGIAVDQGRTAARYLRAREQEFSVNLKAGETSELAGTLAHELSHPLGAISNYAAVINHKLDVVPNLDPEVIDLVSRLRQEVKRATEKIQRLREFFRSGSLRLERTDITQVARECVALLSNKLEATDISVRISSVSGPTYVTADPIQLHSVIHNLVVNAIDELATVASYPKLIAITVRREGDDVMLYVEDTGKGVSPDIADHVFEPMATTKRTGLGLGLSMSKSIVQAHGGRISFEQSSYGGASFCVTLPSIA